MSKAVKIAATVVGVAALALTGVGLVIGATAFAATAIAGISLATLTTALGVTASVLGIAANLMAKKPSFSSTSAGTQLDFIADPTAGEPYVMGDARVGMDIVHEASWGDTNKYLGIIGVLSCAGPIMAYNGLYADDTLIDFASRNAVGYYNDFLYLDKQLGERPEAAALDMSVGASTMPDWGAAYKLSSLAAAGLILVADVEDGKIYSGGTPKFTHQIEGVLAYDPRLDDTHGGVGPQRPTAENSYEYSENPWLHHGTFALGRFVQDIRIIGPGLPADSIDWPSHIEAANVADANGWKVSGRIMSTDRKWEVCKAISQAGGGYSIPTGCKLAALVNTPRVSLETVEESDLKGPVSVPSVALRRVRLNGGIPRFRSPDHAWEIVPGATVRNATYLAADGVERTREIDLPLVADAQQAAELTAYEVANSREISPISFEVGLYWSQYKMGDCITLNFPSALLFNRKCVIIGRVTDAARNTVRFTVRTEDDDKHPWALSVVAGAPPATVVGNDPGAGDVGGTLRQLQQALRATYAKGLAMAGVDTGGGTAKITLSAFTLRYPGKDVPIAATEITGLNNSTTYYPFADVDEVGDNAPTFGATTVYEAALNSADHTHRIFLQQSVATPAGGGGSTGGGGFGGGYGGGGGVIP